MFQSKHYVPILKWKRAEQKALVELENKNKKYITPVIQFVMPKPKSPGIVVEEKNQDEKINEVILKFKEKIPKIPAEILKFWGKNPVFIDASLLYTTNLKAESFEKIITEGNKLGTLLIPILYLCDDQKIKEIACSLDKKYNNGLCLRLICSDFSDLSTLPEKIERFLKSYKLSEENIDLLVDIKEIEGNDYKCLKYINLSQKIPNLLKWRTFTFASGAFPKDLSQCKIDEENLIPRIDWKNWINQINGKKLLRNSSFSDYTIQHPIYDESSQFYPPTTSIKYALENDWLIMKGKKRKFELYLANAKLLSENDEWFSGENFSYGDKFIAEKGRHFEKYQKNPEIKGTGSTETWLTAGINHHLVRTIKQIANLI